MAIAGPRLDRPSAIGDEGRPRAASLTVAALVVAGLAVAVAVLLEVTGILTFVATALTLLVVGMALLQRQSFRSLFGGHLCLHTGLLVLVGITAYAAVFGQWVVTTGFALSLVGIATAWTDTLDEPSFRRTLRQGGRSYAAALALGILTLFFGGLAVAGVLLVEALVSGVDYVTSLLTFLLLLGTVSFVVLLAVRKLPLAEILTTPEDDTTRERLAALERWVKRTLAGSLLGLGVTVALLVFGTVRTVVAAFPPLAFLLQLLSSWVVVVPLLGLGAVAVLVIVFTSRLTALADAVDAGEFESLATWVAAIVLLLAFTFVLFAPVSSPLLAVAAVLGQPIVLVVILFVPVTLADGYMARQASGPALSAVGLVILGIGVNGAGLPTPLTFACVAGAVVVWDLSTFGISLTVELGHIPETRRLELYHAILSVGVGMALVIVLTGIDAIRLAVGSADGRLSGATLALGGVVLLAVLEYSR